MTFPTDLARALNRGRTPPVVAGVSAVPHLRTGRPGAVSLRATAVMAATAAAARSGADYGCVEWYFYDNEESDERPPQ